MYNLKKEEIVLGEITFETTQFPGMESLELMGTLAQSVGPALGVLAASVTEEGGIDIETLAPVLAAALRDLKPAQLSSLALAVLAQTSATLMVDSKLKRIDIVNKDTFNRVFSGPNFKYLFKVLLHALKVNYGDFGLGSDDEALAPKVKE